MTKTEQIREEFSKEIGSRLCEQEMIQEIADWWLLKLEEQKQEMVGEIEKLKEDLYSKPISDDLFSHNFRDGYVKSLDTVLSIIKK